MSVEVNDSCCKGHILFLGQLSEPGHCFCMDPVEYVL